MIQLKTSVLVACALKFSALLEFDSGCNLLCYMLNLGTAFQIHDDIFDVYPTKINLENKLEEI